MSVLQKEVAAKATLSAANRAEIDRLRSALQVFGCNPYCIICSYPDKTQ